MTRLITLLLAGVLVCGAQSIRWGQIRTSETGVYNVKTGPFNAKGNGTTDDTTAIQAAITAATASTSGGVVYFPPGTYKFSRLTVLKPKVYLQGAGVQSTILQTTVTTGSLIQFDSTAESADVRGCGISGLTLYGSLPNTVPLGSEIGIEILGDATSTWYETKLHDLEIRFVANGIKSSFNVDGVFKNITVDVVKKSTGVGIEATNGHERWFNTVKVYNPGGDEGLAGIRVGAGSIGDYFDNISLLGQTNGVLINPGAEGVGTYANYAEWGQFTNLLVDSLTGCGVNIAPQAGKTAGLWVFQNVWSSTVQHGVCVAGAGSTTNIQVNGGRIRGSSGNGFNLTKGTNIQIRGINIESNAGYGIYASNVSNLDVQSNTIGLTSGDTQLYGVYLTGTTDGVNITGNSIRGNATGQIFDNTGNLDKWIGNNQGLDQTGKVVPSNTSITIGPEAWVLLSGTTTVTTVTTTPNWAGRTIYIQATDNSPAAPTLNTGGTAGKTFFAAVTLVKNEVAVCTYSTTSFAWHCRK